MTTPLLTRQKMFPTKLELPRKAVALCGSSRLGEFGVFMMKPCSSRLALRNVVHRHEADFLVKIFQPLGILQTRTVNTIRPFGIERRKIDDFNCIRKLDALLRLCPFLFHLDLTSRPAVCVAFIEYPSPAIESSSFPATCFLPLNKPNPHSRRH